MNLHNLNSEVAKALASRAIACPQFQWRKGMSEGQGDVLLDDCHKLGGDPGWLHTSRLGYDFGDDQFCIGRPSTGAVPDFTDRTTTILFRDVVATAYGACDVHILWMSPDMWELEFVNEEGDATCRRYFNATSPLEALVVALEDFAGSPD